MYNVLYLIATPLTKVFFLVSKIRRKAVGLPMERVNIESEGSEEAEEESRRFKGDDASRSGNRSRKSSLSSIFLSKAVKQLNPEEVDILDWVATIEEVQLQIADSISHTNCGIILFIIYELSVHCTVM